VSLTLRGFLKKKLHTTSPLHSTPLHSTPLHVSTRPFKRTRRMPPKYTSARLVAPAAASRLLPCRVSRLPLSRVARRNRITPLFPQRQRREKQGARGAHACAPTTRSACKSRTATAHEPAAAPDPEQPPCRPQPRRSRIAPRRIRTPNPYQTRL
jgi:hypothetical protein